MARLFHWVSGFDGRRPLLLASVGSAVAVLSLGGGQVVRTVTVGMAGAGAAVLLWTWVAKLRTRVEESRRLALTDDLTGLGNRRRLLADLERAIDAGTDHSLAVLAMFDLSGSTARDIPTACTATRSRSERASSPCATRSTP
jgi:hypothetical protein